MKVRHVSASHSSCQTTSATHAARACNLCPPMAASKQPYKNSSLHNIGKSGPQLRHHFPISTAHGFQSGRMLSSRGGERREGTQTCQASSQTAVLHSEEEARAKDRFLAQVEEDSGDKGLQGSTLNAALALLEEAASTRQVDQELVLGALAHLEETALQGSAPLPDVLPNLEGKWRLVFSSGTVSFLRYIPVKEYIAVVSALRSVDLSSDIGPLYTRFGGKFTWRAPTDMDFSFTSTLVTLFGREVVNSQRDGTIKTWTYFHAGPNIAAARSSVGGLNLMHKESAFALQDEGQED